MSKLDRIDPKVLSTNPRATEPCWLKFRPLVLAAMAVHPKVYMYRPQNMSVMSVESKIRDAIRGKLAFGYAGEPGTAQLLSWWEEVVVKTDDSYVYIGPPKSITIILRGESADPALSNGYSFSTLSFEEVAAFATLLSTGKLLGPVRVQLPPNLDNFTVRQNVEMVNQPDGSLLML